MIEERGRCRHPKVCSGWWPPPLGSLRGHSQDSSHGPMVGAPQSGTHQTPEKWLPDVATSCGAGFVKHTTTELGTTAQRPARKPHLNLNPIYTHARQEPCPASVPSAVPWEHQPVSHCENRAQDLTHRNYVLLIVKK